MENEIIEEYRAKIIEKYGDPTPKIIEGRKYKFINANLNEFEALINALTQTESLLGQSISNSVIEICCYYCLEADTEHIKNITKSIIALNKKFDYEPSRSKKNALSLFTELEADYEKIMQNILFAINYFSAHLNTKLDTYYENHFPNFQRGR